MSHPWPQCPQISTWSLVVAQTTDTGLAFVWRLGPETSTQTPAAAELWTLGNRLGPRPGFLTSACSSPLWTISSSIFLHTVRAPRLCFLFHISTRTPSFLSLHHTSSIGVAPEVGGCVGGVYHSLSIRPFVDMSVGCFRFLGLKNKAAVEHG